VKKFIFVKHLMLYRITYEYLQNTKPNLLGSHYLRSRTFLPLLFLFETFADQIWTDISVCMNTITN
jgi:hypothetical protein